MKTFVFQIAAEPDPSSTLTRDLNGAIATVWVLDKTIESAEKRACHFITGFGWKTKERPYVFEPTPQQIAELDSAETESYQEAMTYGIAARFEIWPQEDDGGCTDFQPFSPPPGTRP